MKRMNERSQSGSQFLRASNLLLALLLVFAASNLLAQQSAPPKAGVTVTPPSASALPAVTAKTPETSGSVAQGKAGEEGVKVHGHWVINVKNPDGKIVEHREFENSLQSQGQGYLIGLLSGYITPGPYGITLGQTNGVCTSVTSPCYILGSLAGFPANDLCNSGGCVAGLTTTFNFGSSFLGPFSLVLNGTLTATNAGSFQSVNTVFTGCSLAGPGASPTSVETNAPSACTSAVLQPPIVEEFTGTTLASPVNVTAGQAIQVIVTISFS
jgi:hypothetical protein